MVEAVEVFLVRRDGESLAAVREVRADLRAAYPDVATMEGPRMRRDFHLGDAARPLSPANWRTSLQQVLALLGSVPVTVVQAELVPWLLGVGDPIQDRVAKRGGCASDQEIPRGRGARW